MEVKEDYLINEKTVLLMGEYYRNGALYTKVLHDKEIFLVAMSPTQLIDQSLLRYGSSLDGALKSSKNILGEIKMYPIKINASLDIWLFPTKSLKSHHNVWFVLNQINDMEPIGSGKTIVLLKYGHSIEIKMKVSAFRNKRQNAKILRERITNNTKGSINFLLFPREGYEIKEDEGTNKYTCVKKDEKRI